MPGFEAIRDDVLGRGGTLVGEAVGETDTVASLAETAVRNGGGLETEALAAARFVYQAFVDGHRLGGILTDRVDVVAPFVDDLNLGP